VSNKLAACWRRSGFAGLRFGGLIARDNPETAAMTLLYIDGKLTVTDIAPVK